MWEVAVSLNVSGLRNHRSGRSPTNKCCIRHRHWCTYHRNAAQSVPEPILTPQSQPEALLCACGCPTMIGRTMHNPGAVWYT